MDELRSLINRCISGQQEAMIELIDRYRGQVFGLCYRMLGQRQDAEDALQETFIRVLRNLTRWDPSREFEPWLLTIAGNRCRTALAARQRRPRMHGLSEGIPGNGPDLRAADLSEEVQLALRGIRSELRQAFVLFHEHELSYAEIAQVMQAPLGTIKTWVHRARRELIQILRQREVIQEPGHAVR